MKMTKDSIIFKASEMYLEIKNMLTDISIKQQENTHNKELWNRYNELYWNIMDSELKTKLYILKNSSRTEKLTMLKSRYNEIMPIYEKIKGMSI